MKIIWKFSVQLADRFALSMPEGAEVLSVQMQGGAPQIWAIVDSDAAKEKRTFRVAGTGHPLDASLLPKESLRFIGTFQFESSGLVFHLFEILN